MYTEEGGKGTANSMQVIDVPLSCCFDCGYLVIPHYNASSY